SGRGHSLVRRANPPPPEPVHRASRSGPMFDVRGMSRLSYTDYLLGNQCLGADRRSSRPGTDVRECERAQSYSLAAENRDGIAPRQAVVIAVDQSSQVVMETSG